MLYHSMSCAGTLAWDSAGDGSDAHLGEHRLRDFFHYGYH